MFLDLEQLADAPPVQHFFRLAEATLDSVEQLTQASLDATREVVEASRVSLLQTDARGIWPRDALALQAGRRERAVQKTTEHYRRLLGIQGELEAARPEADGENPARETLTASDAMLAALQAVWLETASAFGSLQYCPVMRQPGKSES